MDLGCNIVVDHIFCINLEKEKELRNLMEAHLESIGLYGVEFFTAISGNSALGCKLSHLDIIQKSIDKGYESIMILEDDCVFEEFPFKGPSPPEDWDMLYPGYYDFERQSFKHTEGWLRGLRLRNTHCYIIKRRAFDYILRMVGPANEPIDMSYCNISPNLHMYAMYPIRAYQRSHVSSISGSDYDHNGFMKSLSEEAYHRLGKITECSHFAQFNDMSCSWKYPHYVVNFGGWPHIGEYINRIEDYKSIRDPFKIFIDRLPQRVTNQIINPFNKPYREKWVFLQIESTAIISNQINTLKNDDELRDTFDLILTWEPDLFQYSNVRKFLSLYGYFWVDPTPELSKNLFLIHHTGENNIRTYEQKEFNISMLCGNKNWCPGHLTRQSVWNLQDKITIPKKFYHPKNIETIKHFEGNIIIGSTVNKTELFLDSMFHIAIENNKAPNYFTEKLTDCIITKTVPVYWGCTNIGDYYDLRGFIIIDGPEDCISKVNSLTEQLYNDMLPYVENNYRTYLEQKHLDKALHDEIQLLDSAIKRKVGCFYINLERRGDRNTKMKDMLNRFEKVTSIEHYRIKAIDGLKLNFEELIKAKLIKPNHTFTRGEVGCILSAIKAWETFLRSNYTYGIFLEDDVELNPNMLEIFKNLMNEDLNSYELILLGRNSLEHTGFYNGKQISPTLYKPDTIGYGMHSYLLTRKGAQKMLMYYQTLKYEEGFKYYLKYKLDEHDILKQIAKIDICSIIPEDYNVKKTVSNKAICSRSREFLFYPIDCSDSETSK